jgi:O-antigen/teichoic acid export membrane protein
VADYFHDGRLVAVIRIAALRPIILGFENIGVIEFRRTLRFSLEFRYMILQRLASFVFCLAIIFYFRNYLGLAWSAPVSAVVTVCLSYVVVSSRPFPSLSRWHGLWEFSRWQVVFNSTRLLGERCDPFVISRLSNFENTGIYSVAFDLALMPTREIMLPAGRALMPAYSRLSTDSTQLRDAFARVLGLAVLVASSAGVGMCCIADDAVRLVLGNQWQNAVPFVRWLGVYGALEGVWLMLDPYLIAAGREKTLALANVAFAVLIAPIVLFGASRFGIGVIPACRIAVMMISLVAVFHRCVIWRWIAPGHLIGALWRPLVAALAMAAAIQFLALEASHPPVVLLLYKITVGALAFTVCLFGLWRLAGSPDGAEQTLCTTVRSRLIPFFRPTYRD